MKSRLRKDPTMVGKLSNKKIDMSFSSSKQIQPRNNSLIFPALKYNPRYLASNLSFLQQKKDCCTDRFDEQSQQPLPEIRANYSKIQLLSKVCRKNPQEVATYSKRNNLKHTQFHTAKDSDLVGHLYSPRSRSIIHSYSKEVIQDKMTEIKPSRFKNFLQQQYGKQLAKKQSQASNTYKLIQYNRKLNESMSSVGLHGQKDKKQQQIQVKEQCTQSRVIPIQPTTNEKKIVQKKVLGNNDEVFLKNDGDKGYVQVDATEIKGEQNQLKFLWEENYLQVKQNNINKPQFWQQTCNKQEAVQIAFTTTISYLKTLLIQQQNTFKLNFLFSDTLKHQITDKIAHPQMHVLSQKIFASMLKNFKPQLISMKKFNNCILMTTKAPKESNHIQKSNRMAILWYYSGKFYVGGWRIQQNGTQGYKCGVGMQYYPQNYIYYGNFERNMRTGYGVMKKVSKEIYLGQWTNNKRQGWGKVFGFQGQLIYDGDFEDGRLRQNRIISKNL